MSRSQPEEFDHGSEVIDVVRGASTLGKGAEMLTGEREGNIEKLLELVAAKGGLK